MHLGGGAAPSPQPSSSCFFFKAYLLCRDSPPPPETSPPPLETIEKQIISQNKKIIPKIFPHPIGKGVQKSSSGGVETKTPRCSNRKLSGLANHVEKDTTVRFIYIYNLYISLYWPVRRHFGSSCFQVLRVTHQVSHSFTNGSLPQL